MKPINIAPDLPKMGFAGSTHPTYSLTRLDLDSLLRAVAQKFTK